MNTTRKHQRGATVHRTVRLPHELDVAARRIAEQEERSLGSVLRRALAADIERRGEMRTSG